VRFVVLIIAMITNVARWRCKCGVSVKVVGQTPKNKPAATQTAACPNCGDRQILYGETIISISVEKEGHLRESSQPCS
jgi:hypothetical protein